MIDLTGLWKGTIVYGKGYKQYIGKELYFDMDIIQYGNEIAGTAKDTGGVGMSPDSAQILGSIINNKITFLKQYSSFHYQTADGGVKVNKNFAGPMINYNGSFDAATEAFTGHWNIKLKYRLFGIIPLTLKCSGIWMMSRK